MISIAHQIISADQGLDTLFRLVQRYEACELWLFGSAAHPAASVSPNDVDLAVLGLPALRIDELKLALRRSFPASRVEHATAYTAFRSQVCRAELPLHFLLSTERANSDRHAVFSSIRGGRCLWRATR